MAIYYDYTYLEWEGLFKPVSTTARRWYRYPHEFGGEEYDIFKHIPNEYIWTRCASIEDDDEEFIASGCWRMNALAYYVTLYPWVKEDTTFVRPITDEEYEKNAPYRNYRKEFKL